MEKRQDPEDGTGRGGPVKGKGLMFGTLERVFVLWERSVSSPEEVRKKRERKRVIDDRRRKREGGLGGVHDAGEKRRGD